MIRERETPPEAYAKNPKIGMDSDLDEPDSFDRAIRRTIFLKTPNIGDSSAIGESTCQDLR